jgi:hypothetical protein
VRLHNLGDFYSVGYVELWRTLLERHAALHCFGFTARIDSVDDEIAYAVARLVKDRWPRFAIRFSNGPVGRCSTVSIESPVQKPKDALFVPPNGRPPARKPSAARRARSAGRRRRRSPSCSTDLIIFGYEGNQECREQPKPTRASHG